MDKLKQAGQTPGRVFNFRHGCAFAQCASFVADKLPDLQWKTRHKQHFWLPPVSFLLPAATYGPVGHSNSSA